MVFSFLTADATPVLLLDEVAREPWINAPIEDALFLQKTRPPSTFKIATLDTKQDIA